MPPPSHVGEYPSINMSRLYLRGDISLKIRDQTGGVRVPAVGAVAQALEQLLQQKQITKGKRLIIASWRHVASDALESDKISRGELSRYRSSSGVSAGGRPLALAAAMPSRVLIRRLWLGSAHHAASNRAMLPSGPVSDSSKSVKSTADFGAWELACRTRPRLCGRDARQRSPRSGSSGLRMRHDKRVR